MGLWIIDWDEIIPKCCEASRPLKTGIVVSPLSLILTLIGMVYPYWLSDNTGMETIGIWQICNHTDTMDVCTSFSTMADLTGPDAYPDFIKATAVFVVLGCIVGGIATFVVFAVVCVEYVNRNKVSHVMAVVLHLLAGVLVLLGVIIFSAKYEESFAATFLSWAFVLCTVGSAGFLITGCILILDVRQKWYL